MVFSDKPNFNEAYLHNQQGISLTELLVSLLLANFIVLILVNQYSISKKHYETLHQLIERDIELQLITDLMRNSIQHAGFTPCGNLNLLSQKELANNVNVLQAIQATTNGKVSSLVLQRMNEPFTTIQKTLNPLQLMVSQDLFSIGQRILISDCFHIEMQTIAEIQPLSTGWLLTLENPLHFKYHSPIYVGGWLKETFFIKNNARKKALYYKVHRTDELSLQVKAMNFNSHWRKSEQFMDVILELNHGKSLRLTSKIRN